MDKNKEEIYHAWYSDIALQKGCSLNQYLSEDNNNVAVTHVYREYYKPSFSDIVYMGKVTKWMENIVRHKSITIK